MQMRWTEFIGEIVDERYTLREVTGDDEMAADSEHGPVTLRFMPEELPEANAFLVKWAETARLSHPGLLRVYSTGKTVLGEVPLVFVAMERPDDCLGEVLKERPLTAEEAKQVIEAVLPCVEYLHSQGLTHGNLRADQIVAVGDRIKLTSEPVRQGDPELAELDLHAVGDLIGEILAKPMDELPEPFREVAGGCKANPPWTVRKLLNTLRNERPVLQIPILPPEPKAKPGIPWAIVAGVAAVLMVMITAWAMRREDSNRVSVMPPVSAATIPQAAPLPTAPVPARSERSRVETPASRGEGNWAVVSAIYRNYDAAEKRAQRLRDRSKEFEPRVFPAKGEGKRYMVLIESGLSRDDAEKLKRRAIAAGLPRDTYVTRVATP